MTTCPSPFYDKITLDLPWATQPLVITAPGASSGKTYVAGLTVNGVPLEQPVIQHDMIKNGGTVAFEMSESPSAWASGTLAGTSVNTAPSGFLAEVLISLGRVMFSR